MERHLQVKHWGSLHPIKVNQGFYNQKINSRFSVPSIQSSNKVGHISDNTLDEFPFPGFDRSMNMMKKLAEFGYTTNKFQNPSPVNSIELQNQLNSVSRQLLDLQSNNWIIPKSQIFGISGYFCKRCQCFTFRFVRDPGYDRTAEAKHICDEQKVRSIHAVSIRPSDAAANDNFFAKELWNSLNFFMHGTKYLICVDLSKAHNELTGALNSDIAKLILGIPDRYCLYTIKEAEMPIWLNRALENLGKKTLVQENEAIDFLGIAKSSYAIFEILTGHSIRMIYVCLLS